MAQAPMRFDEQQAAEAYRRVAERDPLFAPHCELTFESIEELGAGGMGSVIRVRDRRLDREAALKILTDCENLELRERFLREGRILARLDHPGIPPIYELGRGPSGQPYILMRLIEGRTLRALLDEREAEDDPRPLLQILARIAEAVAYAHARGIVHRDLKPENIMVGEYGAVFVVDWGLARDLEGREDDAALAGLTAVSEDEATRSGLTLEGAVMGTPGYMAPEQAEGRPADRRADVFALGCILTEALTGQRAVEGAGVLARLSNTIKGRVRAPRDLDSSAPEELDDFARRCLARNPKARPRHAGAFGRELKRILAMPPKGRPWWLALTWLAGTTLIAVALTAFGILSYERGRQREADLARAGRELQQRGEERKRARFLYDIALRDYKADRQKQACLLLDMALELDPELADAHNLRGSVFKKLGRYAEARSDYNAAIDLNKTFALPLINRGILSYEENDFAAARRDFEKAVALDPKNALAIKQLGDLEAAAERWKEALLRYSEAIAIKPSFAEAYLDRGLAAEALGNKNEALEDLTEAIDLDPKLTRAFVCRAGFYVGEGKLKEALEDLNQAAILTPEDSTIFAMRAEIHIMRGEPKRVVEELDRALKLDPKNVMHHYHRGMNLAALGQTKKALRDLEEAARLDEVFGAKIRQQIEDIRAGR